VEGTPLTGVLLPGDRFRVNGDPQVYTVTTTVLASNDTLIGVPFTPASEVAWDAGALLTFLNHSIAKTRQWVATVTLHMLDVTVQGQTARTRRTGLVEWEGSFEGLFDYDDPDQKALLDRFTQAKPAGQVVAVSFSVSPDGPVTLYGAAVLTTLAVTSPGEDLVTIAATFQSTNQMQAVPIVPATIGPGDDLALRYTEGFEQASAAITPQYTEPFDVA
jgi:hypothetical protein